MKQPYAIILCSCLAAALLATAPAIATNGMNMIGFDAIAAGMGGADAAVDDGVKALACNPANLTSVDGSEFTANLSLLGPRLNFKNETYFGANDVAGKNQIFPLPFIGFADRIGTGGLVWGIGLFAQGGMGVDFTGVKTNFGTEDSIYSNVAYGKLVPALAYEISDSLSVGFSFQIGYSSMEYNFFPSTSYYDPGPDGQPMTADDMVFPGQEMVDTYAFGYSGRLGLTWKITDSTAVGVAYTSEADLDYEKGTLRMNFESLGLGKVSYDASVSGFTWPASVDIGISQYLMDKRLLLAADLTWYNWSDAVKTVTVKGKNPDNPYANAEVEIPFKFNWEDQWVIAVGGEFKATPDDVIRLGYNYGESPVPEETMYPLFPAIVEQHATIGYGHTFGDLILDLAYEHAFNKTVKNTNANMMENPFGSASEVDHSQNSFHVMLTYRW